MRGTEYTRRRYLTDNGLAIIHNDGVDIGGTINEYLEVVRAEDVRNYGEEEVVGASRDERTVREDGERCTAELKKPASRSN